MKCTLRVALISLKNIVLSGVLHSSTHAPFGPRCMHGAPPRNVTSHVTLMTHGVTHVACRSVVISLHSRRSKIVEARLDNTPYVRTVGTFSCSLSYRPSGIEPTVTIALRVGSRAESRSPDTIISAQSTASFGNHRHVRCYLTER